MPVVFANGEGGLSIRNKINESFTKINGIAEGATANATDAALRDRTTHTGTQAAGTITGLATVATSGAYTDLSGLPALGSAAYASSLDFATAVQGELAGTAVQPGDDAATLGSGAALDGYVLTANGAGVAAWEVVPGGGGGTNLTYTAATRVIASDTGTDATLTLATGTDAGLMAAADFTKLAGVEAAADVTDTANVTAAGALMDSEVTNLAAVKAFAPADYATAAQGGLADTAVQPAGIAAFETSTELNARDTANRSRANHTGTQAVGTITGLATVATSGAYTDLTGLPTLGTAAATAATDYATAAQGALADTAVQPAALDDAVELTTINAQTGTAYTLALTDRGQTVTCTNAAAVTVTIPANATVAFPVGTVVFIVALGGAGAVTVTGAAGVTINGVVTGSETISGAYQGASLLKISTEAWVVTGSLT